MADITDPARSLRTIIKLLWLIIALVLLLALLVFLRTQKQCVMCSEPDRGTDVSGMIDRSPCDSVTRPVPEVVIALTGGDSYEHEVHDCQRLVIAIAPDDNSDGREYDFGPLVGVFPLDSAMSLESASEFANGLPVATVYNWGGFGYDGDPIVYQPLGIKDGWSCLWLRHTTGPDHQGWEAAIHPLSGSDSTCADATDTTDIAWNLTAGHLIVRLLPADSVWASGAENGHDPPPTGGVEPFPRTARWGWDSSTNQHYIGIRCGRAWCVIGPSGFNPPRDAPTGRYHRDIPGWYDEEHLAVPGAGRVVPGPWAAIYPTDSLFELRGKSDSEINGRFTRDIGIEVAVMEVTREAAGLPLTQSSLDQGFAGYDSKLNLDANGVSTIWLQLDASMKPTSRYREGPPGVFTVASAGVGGNSVRYEHAMHAVMGAVRWRWLDTDQDQWEPCGVNACCDTGP